MTNFLVYIAATVALIGFSLACSFLANKKEFSMNIFLTAITLGICILTWTGFLPIFTIIFAAFSIIAVLFGTNRRSEVSG